PQNPDRIASREPLADGAGLEPQATFDVPRAERLRRGELRQTANAVAARAPSKRCQHARASDWGGGTALRRRPGARRIEDQAAPNYGALSRIGRKPTQYEAEPSEARKRRLQDELRQTRLDDAHAGRSTISSDVHDHRCPVLQPIFESSDGFQ